jgi:hypothetical protein
MPDFTTQIRSTDGTVILDGVPGTYDRRDRYQDLRTTEGLVKLAGLSWIEGTIRVPRSATWIDRMVRGPLLSIDIPGEGTFHVRLMKVERAGSEMYDVEFTTVGGPATASVANPSPTMDHPSIDDQMDDLIDRWHAGEGLGVPLSEWLGMTWDDYRAWVKDAGCLPRGYEVPERS